MVVVLLTLTGLVSVEKLRASRGYVVIGIFVVAAVLTPPDPLSQLMMASPDVAALRGRADLRAHPEPRQQPRWLEGRERRGRRVRMSGAHQRRMLVLCLATVYLVWGTSYIATRVGVLQSAAAAVRWHALRDRWNAAAGRCAVARLPTCAAGGPLAACAGDVVDRGGHQQWPADLGDAMGTFAHQRVAQCILALWIVVFGLFGARAHKPGTRAAMRTR